MVTVTGIAPGASGVANQHGTQDGPDRTRSGSLRLAAIFSDHMVLQRNKPIAIFGSAAPGLRITITLIGELDATIAESAALTTHAGTWLGTLPALPAGGPYTLLVSCETDFIACNDVMIGEVWLAGGQSNIEFELYNAEGGSEAVAQANDRLLRFYNTPKSGEINEAAEANSSWEIARSPYVEHMSAVAYYFAEKLRSHLDKNIAIGIVDCYIGGTSISCWMSRERLLELPAGKPYVERYDTAIQGKTDKQMHAEADAWQQVFDKWNADVATTKEERPGITQPEIDKILGPCPWPPPTTPFSERSLAAPFHGMVERVAPYTVAGILWYQGEEDEAYCESYEELLRALIAQWRELWDIRTYNASILRYTSATDEALPFLLVQLPQWIDGQTAEANADPLHWPVIREAQSRVADSVSEVYMISTMDCGEFDNIHPVDKRTVGERLGKLALRVVYADAQAPAFSPRVTEVQTAGKSILVDFAHANGLHFHGTTPDTMRVADTETAFAREAETSGFELAGEDGVYVPACARMRGTTVEVSANSVPTPSHVRYAWKSWGPAPLFNEEGLPAVPFQEKANDTAGN